MTHEKKRKYKKESLYTENYQTSQEDRGLRKISIENFVQRINNMFAKVTIGIFMVCALFGTLNAFDVGPDEDCPQICPLLYSPICGTDGLNFQEFSNPCELQANNCRMERGLAKRKC